MLPNGHQYQQYAPAPLAPQISPAATMDGSRSAQDGPTSNLNAAFSNISLSDAKAVAPSMPQFRPNLPVFRTPGVAQPGQPHGMQNGGVGPINASHPSNPTQSHQQGQQANQQPFNQQAQQTHQANQQSFNQPNQSVQGSLPSFGQTGQPNFQPSPSFPASSSTPNPSMTSSFSPNMNASQGMTNPGMNGPSMPQFSAAQQGASTAGPGQQFYPPNPSTNTFQPPQSNFQPSQPGMTNSFAPPGASGFSAPQPGNFGAPPPMPHSSLGGQMPMSNGPFPPAGNPMPYPGGQIPGQPPSMAAGFPGGLPGTPGMMPGMGLGGPPGPPRMPGMPGMPIPPNNMQGGPPQQQMGQPMGQPGYTNGPTGMNNRNTPALSLESLPSVVDVLEKDIVMHANSYYESRLNSVPPPLITSKVRSVDYGNSVPELLRSSLYAAPCTANLLKESGIPFVLHIQPMAELAIDAPPIHIVNHGEKGPVRCNRCKAYMSPYMKFIDGGRKFQCPFCLISTDVPQDYFAYLDSEGRRVDCMQRPELCLGTYEFLATKDYCRNEKLPEPPAFIFMIDVSYRAVSSGFTAMLCQMLRNELDSLLPVEPNGEESKLRVGIATFSDSVNFFNLKAGLKQPTMMTVNDFSDMFVPLVDGFLVRPEESARMLESLLDFIPQIFAQSRQTDTILYPVIQSGMRALEAAGCPGKLFVFNFSLPVFDAPGKLKNREDRQILGTDKEKTLLKPQIPDYTELAKNCVQVGCSVDLFLFPNSYIDVATLGEVSKLTGGQVYKYAYFQADKDGQRFLWDLRHNLKRTIAFDAVMRVRTNQGIRPTDYFGNMLMPNTTEVHLASVDSEKTILAEIKHDDKLEDKTVVHVQVALLYTSLSAQRRVRLLNMALMSTSDYGEIYRCAEGDVVMNFMLKNSLKGLYDFSPAQIREGLTERSTKILVSYRKHCSQNTPVGQLVLPESFKLMPLYTNCLVRNDVVSGTGSEVGADDRSWLMYHSNSLGVEHTTAFLYPRFYVLHEPGMDSSTGQYRQIRATGEKIQEGGVYLLENGVAMFLWLGSRVDAAWTEAIFGVQSPASIDTEKGEAAMIAPNNPTAEQLFRFIERTRNSRPVYMRLNLIRQRDKMEGWFRRFLVEDQGTSTYQQSYVQYIYYLYNAIRDEVDK